MVAQEEIIDILPTKLIINQLKIVIYLLVQWLWETTAKNTVDMLNNGKGSPIEIDVFSNNGVDNIRSIIEQANLEVL